MEIVKSGRVAEDPWVYLTDASNPEPGQPVIVSLERWLRDRGDIMDADGPVGVKLRSDQALDDIANDLDGLSLVAIEIADPSDGRIYSLARLMRESYGYEGEIRAVGDIRSDQLPFMERCGIDAFEFPPGRDARIALASVERISVDYREDRMRRFAGPAVRAA